MDNCVENRPGLYYLSHDLWEMGSEESPDDLPAADMDSYLRIAIIKR